MAMKIKIDGEIYTIEKVHNYSYLPIIDTDEGPDFYVAENSESAGEAARKYWEDLAHDDPKEFACLVGESTLVQWGLGQSAGPGSTQVNSLEEWLDLWLDVPEEEFASYDGAEREINRVGKLRDELGFTPTVAYRHN